MVEKMPEKTAEELETECLRLLRADMHTRDIHKVKIVRVRPPGDGPNWTWAFEPEPPPIAMQHADEIVASVAGRWALRD
jgi:hypothetical protein